MTNDQQYTEEEVLRAKLNGETAVVEWPELAVHFARGVVIKVGQSVSLVDVATKMGLDQREDVAAYLNSGDVAKASDDDARDWNKRQPLLWCVVAAPWVLVQEKPGTSDGEQLH